MKLKYADRLNWARITEKRYKQLYVEKRDFTGYVAALFLDKVTAPLIVKYGNHEKCIVNNGYVWIQHFPLESHYCLTTMFDDNGEIIQWYIDIIKTQDVTEQGVPFIEDLYLDVVLLPGGELFVLDEDELEEALLKGQINKNEYEMARHEVRIVVEEIKTGRNKLIGQAQDYYKLMKELNE